MVAAELFAVAILVSGSPSVWTLFVVLFGVVAIASPWLTVKEAAARARVGVKVIYREVAAGRLKAARVGNRRDLRFLDSYVDDWLTATTMPVLVVPRKRA